MRTIPLGTAAGLLALALALGSSACSGGPMRGALSGGEQSGDATMVVPFGAGGGSDVAGRAAARGLEDAASTSIAVENRDGGNGAVGYSYLLGKRGDPSYLLAAETALLALPMTADTDYDYTDFTPIMSMGEDFTLLVVDADSPLKSCPQVVERSRSHRVVAGTSGATGLDNVVFGMVERRAGANFDRVPFESGSEVLTSLLGGRIDIASLNPSEVLGQLKAGDVRALCVFADQRYELKGLRGIPTAKEEGIDVSYGQFRGLVAPGGISADAREHWIQASREFVRSDTYDSYMRDNYLQPDPLYGEDFRRYLDRSNDELEGVLKP